MQEPGWALIVQMTSRLFTTKLTEKSAILLALPLGLSPVCSQQGQPQITELTIQQCYITKDQMIRSSRQLSDSADIHNLELSKVFPSWPQAQLKL